MINVVVLAGLAFLTLSSSGCRPQKKHKENCEGNTYSTNHLQDKFILCHEDANHNNLFDQNELFVRQQSNRIFKPWNQSKISNTLFDLKGEKISDWVTARKNIFKDAQTTVTEELYFSKLYEIWQQESLPRDEIYEFASYIQSGSQKSKSSQENLYSHMIATLLVKIKIYLKISSVQNSELDTFFKTIEQKIKIGKLKVVHQNDFQKNGSYYYRTNTMRLGLLIDQNDQSLMRNPLNSFIEGTLFHELWHFYQDIQKISESRLQSEREANVATFSFLLRNYLGIASSDAEQVRTYILEKYYPTMEASNFPKFLEAALDAAYAQTKNNTQDHEKNLNKFDEEYEKEWKKDRDETRKKILYDFAIFFKTNQNKISKHIQSLKNQLSNN